jgi:siroheme synthase-like protein
MDPSAAAPLYPIFLKIEGRKVLVVGAGPVAESKIASLIVARARVVVVAPEATPGVQALARSGAVDWHRRAFQPDDADGAWLIVAATSDAAVQASTAAAGEARSLFVLAVDDIPNASAYSGALLRRAPFTVAISSSGEVPALSRLLREILEDILPEADWVDHAKRLRASWIARGTPIGERFGELVRAFAARQGK